MNTLINCETAIFIIIYTKYKQRNEEGNIKKKNVEFIFIFLFETTGGVNIIVNGIYTDGNDV